MTPNMGIFYKDVLVNLFRNYVSDFDITWNFHNKYVLPTHAKIYLNLNI